MPQVRLLHGRPLMRAGKVALSDACCCGGACCTTDLWPANVCTQSSQADCEAGGGNYLGDGTECADIFCNEGACCEFDGDCTETQDFFCGTCIVGAGSCFMGYGTTCETTRCEGACCCFPAGDCLGFDLTYAECTAACPTPPNTSGWLLNGDCETLGCGEEATGACCCAGDCFEGITQANCEASECTYVGDDTTCTPNPC